VRRGLILSKITEFRPKTLDMGFSTETPPGKKDESKKITLETAKKSLHAIGPVEAREFQVRIGERASSFYQRNKIANEQKPAWIPREGLGGEDRLKNSIDSR